MSISGIQGQLLEVTVVGCNKLKDTEWISRQDPYVSLEYASTKYRTRTHTDGGKNPTFQEKFVFNLIQGLPEFSITVWNSNTLSYDDFIGNGKVLLQKVLLQGYDDSSWPIQDKRGRHAGEVRLIMHYAGGNNPANWPAASAPPYAGAQAPQVPLYSAPPPTPLYPGMSYQAPPSYPSYPPSPYHHHHQHQPGPAAYHPTYPPSSAYPPYPTYPPPPQNPPYYPPAPYPYPPPY